VHATVWGAVCRCSAGVSRSSSPALARTCRGWGELFSANLRRKDLVGPVTREKKKKKSRTSRAVRRTARGNNLQSFKDFYLKAKARTWP